MISLGSYIVEKFKISKNTNIKPENIDLLSYGEFLHKLSSDIDGLPVSEANHMLSDKCFPNVKLLNYKYFYVDPEKWSGHWHYKYYIEDCETLLKNKKYEEYTLKKLYVDKIIHLSVYHYINVNLSGDEGDEHYIYFIDDMNKKYYIYQVRLKDESENIKKLV